MSKSIFMLSYVNLPEMATIYYDRKFDTVIELMVFVNTEHPEHTSYAIMVAKVDANV